MVDAGEQTEKVVSRFMKPGARRIIAMTTTAEGQGDVVARTGGANPPTGTTIYTGIILDS